MTALWSAVSGDGAHGNVALVHGALDRSAGLLRLSRRLDDRFRVLRYDRRGYGRSLPHDGPFAMVDQVGDLTSLLEVVGDSDCGVSMSPSVVVGHSYGGNVALAAAQQRPDLIGAVVVYESPLSWRPWWPHGRRGDAADDWTHDPAAAAEGFMRSLIGDDRWERLPPSSRRARRAEGVAMVQEMVDLRAHAPWEPAHIEVPVLALYGAEGQAHHQRAAHTIADEISAAEVAAVADAGHFGPNTHPDAVADAITDFLRRRLPIQAD